MVYLLVLSGGSQCIRIARIGKGSFHQLLTRSCQFHAPWTWKVKLVKSYIPSVLDSRLQVGWSNGVKRCSGGKRTPNRGGPCRRRITSVLTAVFVVSLVPQGIVFPWDPLRPSAFSRRWPTEASAFLIDLGWVWNLPFECFCKNKLQNTACGVLRYLWIRADKPVNHLATSPSKPMFNLYLSDRNQHRSLQGKSIAMFQMPWLVIFLVDNEARDRTEVFDLVYFFHLFMLNLILSLWSAALIGSI